MHPLGSPSFPSPQEWACACEHTRKGSLALQDEFKKDIATLETLGITTKQIADRLQTLISKGESLYKQAVQLGMADHKVAHLENGTFEVTGFDQGCMGFMPCPFSPLPTNPCGKGRKHYAIKNLQSGETLEISELQLHILRNHSSFSRLGAAAQRLCPAKVSKLLQLQPHIDYSTELHAHHTWVSINHCKCPQDYEQLLENYDRAITLETGTIKGYLLPFREPYMKEAEQQKDAEGHSYLHLIAQGTPLETEHTIDGALLSLSTSQKLPALTIYKRSSEITAEPVEGQDLIISCS
jgi:hypothetical protein